METFHIFDEFPEGKIGSVYMYPCIFTFTTFVQVIFGYRVFRYSDGLSRGCQDGCQAFC